MTHDVSRTLPPDPSVPGLWWVRGVDGGASEWEVWRWSPSYECWWCASGWVHPDTAAEDGWRCVSPAVPPENPDAA